MFDWWEHLSALLVFDGLGLIKGSPLGEAVHFFIYDTFKIYMLLVLIIFAVSFLRTYFNT